MALIEIDGLPLKNGGSFHGYVSHNQRVWMVFPYVSFSMALRGFPSSDGLFGCSTFVIFQGDVLLPWCWKVDHLRVQILLASWSASGKLNPTFSDKYLASGVKSFNPHWAKHLTAWLYVFLKKVHHKVPLHLPIGFQLKWQRIGGSMSHLWQTKIS